MNFNLGRIYFTMSDSSDIEKSNASFLFVRLRFSNSNVQISSHIISKRCSKYIDNDFGSSMAPQ